MARRSSAFGCCGLSFRAELQSSTTSRGLPSWREHSARLAYRVAASSLSAPGAHSSNALVYPGGELSSQAQKAQPFEAEARTDCRLLVAALPVAGVSANASILRVCGRVTLRETRHAAAAKSARAPAGTSSSAFCACASPACICLLLGVRGVSVCSERTSSADQRTTGLLPRPPRTWLPPPALAPAEGARVPPGTGPASPAE